MANPNSPQNETPTAPAKSSAWIWIVVVVAVVALIGFAVTRPGFKDALMNSLESMKMEETHGPVGGDDHKSGPATSPATSPAPAPAVPATAPAK